MTVLLNYSNPDRHYHNFQHIHDMLSSLDVLFSHRLNDSELRVLEKAIAYHDTIYVAGSAANEHLSAQKAHEELKGTMSDYNLMEVVRLILLTKHHVTVPEDIRGSIMIDLDLKGLAGDQYNANKLNVRKEYSAFSESSWKEGRLKFIESFLNRPWIYYTDWGRDNWEKPARENLVRERNELNGWK